MFDDPQKELLTDDASGDWPDRELAEVRQLLGDVPEETPAPKAAAVRNFAGNFGMDDYVDEDDEVPDNELSQKRSVRNLVIVALLEFAGIVGILAYWATKLL